MNTATIGLDIAKNVFQVYGVDQQGKRCCNESFVAARYCGSCEASAMSRRDRGLSQLSLLGP